MCEGVISQLTFSMFIKEISSNRARKISISLYLGQSERKKKFCVLLRGLV